MSYSGDAAEQIVRMSLNGVEIAAKISGRAAERLAVLLYAVLKDQNRTRGKVRLTNMLKSGKELKVFAVKDGELEKFSKAAKQYGVLYCILKDTKTNDGLVDVMVRAEDASKVNRIFERFSLATIDMASVKTEIEKTRETQAKKGEAMPEPEKNDQVKDRVDEFLNSVVGKQEENKEKANDENPQAARSPKTDQSGRSSGRQETGEDRTEGRKSVRKEMKEIRQEMQEEKKKEERLPENRHIEPKPKKRKGKEERS